MKRMLACLLAVAVFVTSCQKGRDEYNGIFKGPEQKFQHGKAWTWIQLDKHNKPERIGISIDEAAMNSLDPGNAHEGGHQHVNGISLKFHPRANCTPFMHALLDWNPHGHEPEGIYDQPHFDFHFYMTSEADRLAIPPYTVDSTGFLNFPPQGYLPQLYVPVPGGVPQMGAHWVDVTSPELNGQLFTQTFIYGSYNGNVTFYEPMITKAFLDANPSFERTFPVPAKFAQSGYYPTKMRIQKIDGVTNIILEGFVYRQAS